MRHLENLSNSIHDWDVADNDISVGYLTEDYGLHVYQDGKYEGLILAGNIPSFPVLIVKNNERMKISSPATRVSEAKYDFIDPEFDGRNVIETKTTKYDREIATEPCNNFVSANELDPLVIGAYNEFRNNDYAAHRDYIYYGMTNEITAGKRNAHIYEYIAKFALATLDSQFISCSKYQAGIDKVNADVSGVYVLHSAIWEGSDGSTFLDLNGDGNLTNDILSELDGYANIENLTNDWGQQLKP
ncbi:MAG: hypothetical protein NC115_03785 [Bacteroidales bacterium]|nr:hypothetical protein [Bacteroidales bacterium]